MTIREKGVERLFKLILDFGHSFSLEYWSNIINGVIKSMFGEIMISFKNKSSNSQEEELRKNVVAKAFNYLTYLMKNFLPYNPGIFQDLINIIVKHTDTSEEVVL